MDTRRVLLANVWIQLALVLAIVVFANMLSARHFTRLDVTQDRLYSLDESSKRIAGRLDRPLVVKAYFTRGLQAPFNNHEQIVRDKLDEYVAYARGHVKVTVVDPGTDADLVKEAQKYGLTQLEYTVRDADRSELRKTWMGVVLLYGDRQEVLPAVTDLSTLEYDLSSAIHRLQQKVEDRPTLAYAVGHGEPDPAKAEGPLRTMLESLSRRFTIRALPLGGAGMIPEEVDALLIVGPQSPLPDRALYQIDQLLMRGGAAAMFVTNTRPDLRTFRPQRVTSGLEPLLGHYGIRVNRDMVIDRVQNGMMRFPVRVGNKSTYREINYPLIPRSTDLSRTSVLVSGLDGLLFPFTSTVHPPETPAIGVEVEVLARTAASAGAVQSLKTVDPTQFGKVLPDEKRGPFPVLVSLKGPLRSFYETRPVPAPDAAIAAVAEDPEEPPMRVEGANTRLVVAGSADFVANNPAFMLNLCDWMVLDESLIGIRSKVTSVPTISPTTPGERLGWKAFNLLAGPLVLLALGASRQAWFRRRARRSLRRAA